MFKNGEKNKNRKMKFFGNNINKVKNEPFNINLKEIKKNIEKIR
jgi:hypothetical protein